MSSKIHENAVWKSVRVGSLVELDPCVDSTLLCDEEGKWDMVVDQSKRGRPTRVALVTDIEGTVYGKMHCYDHWGRGRPSPDPDGYSRHVPKRSLRVLFENGEFGNVWRGSVIKIL